MTIDTLIAKRVRDLRKARGYTLDELAESSGVSRSMISLIERQETSPTAVVLAKLADALDVTLAALFSDEPGSTAAEPLARLSQQHVWKDPASGYVRRHVSPSGFTSPIELVEVTFPSGKSVAFENVMSNVVRHQQIWVLEGEMEVTLGDRTWHLQTGDCLAMVLDQPLVFRNSSRKPARYAVALTTHPINSRKA
ncbi:MAG: XRE family transcriptional regulator [Paraburkholderia sp.]|uniref:helix-turn-helix domain-containing protein n=1 Tax=Paraburkholderia sp. TaxID=1926495 RepID=UPI0011F9ABF7|nr:XRE family transcriptional regulator [Paraburkholderia sp.]TAL99782.1 MAG: XRE family transcriptional regulator [Paraburkholderia sp.]TAM30962.1 MAG: XRE family transcriptional regulator [Paraburkholderia sp.]